MKWALTLVTIVMSFALLLQPSCGRGNNDEHSSEFKSFEPAVEAWVDQYLDEISDDIGVLVTIDLPIARDIASEAVKKAVFQNLQWKITEVEAHRSGQGYAVRVRFTFPLKVDLPVFSKEYKIQADYVLHVRDGSVVDSDIDLDSFQME